MPFINGLLFASVFFLGLGPATSAWAYLDPGTGSILVQLVLGGFAGGLVIVRLYWQSFKNLFSAKKPPEARE